MEKYEHAFSAPLELPFAVSAETARKVFPLPQKIVEGSLPDLAQVRKAAEAPQGAIVDFSGVHGFEELALKYALRFHISPPQF